MLASERVLVAARADDGPDVDAGPADGAAVDEWSEIGEMSLP